MVSRLQAAIGTSELADPAAAGRAAVTDALSRFPGGRPDLLVVYASVRYDLPTLVRESFRVGGGTSLIGASSSGHFHGGTLTPPDRGVAVLALGGGPYRFGVAAVRGVGSDPFDAGRILATAARRAVGAVESPFAGMLLLSCGISYDLQELLNGIHRVTGTAVPVVGGTASDDRLMRDTYVFCGDQVLTDAAVAVWVGSARPLSVVRGHGWRPLGLPQLVTDVDGQVVRTIGGRPAKEVFAEHLRAAEEPGDLVSVEVGGRHAAGRVVRLGEVGRCFGIVDRDGVQILRGVFVDPDGEIRTFAPLPPFCAIQIMSCGQDDLLGVCERVVGGALAGGDVTGSGVAGYRSGTGDRPGTRYRFALGPQPFGAYRPGVVLAFSCVARLEMLRDRQHEEASRLQAAAGDVPTFGFYTYGEFARTTSAFGFHNATIAAVAL
ncbi:MAG: hypothetical protein GXX79_05095 [Actinomycetales bacterium]|nr:hypothetical protein [Actinomycetales bacterium]